MPPSEHMAEMDDAIISEQIRVYIKELSTGNLWGAVVLSFVVWGAAEFAPLWTWAPALAVVYAVTAIRVYLIYQYRQNPAARTHAQWRFGLIVTAAIVGAGWGFADTAMCAHIPVEHQLLVVAVAAVAVSYVATAGYAYVAPPRTFVCTSLVPLTIWFYTGGDRLHLAIGILLTLYIPILWLQGTKHHRSFIELLQLRFKNEFLAKELGRQVEIAEEAALAKARFLAAASHDLRQPVQALTFFHELIRPEMKLTAKGDAHFAMAQQSVKAVHGLLDALLDISRLDAATIKVECERFPVAESLDQMLDEFGAAARLKDVELRIVQSSIWLDTDPLLLGQLLRNLVSNALRYTPSGKVLVGCRRRQDRLAIEVWDSGIGIHADHQRAIFSEFFQVGNPERNRQKGLGLGLAIVDRVAKLLGATIAVRSAPGKGSCFSVSLPLSIDPASSPVRPLADARNSAAPASLEGRLVIVVENEDMIRHGLHTLLENWGCDVISGSCRDSIWTQVQGVGRTVSAVISDFGLPGGENGIDVIREFRSQLGYEFAALLITGDTSSSVLQAANGAGFTLLHKPIQPQLLHQTLAAAMVR